MKKNLLKFTIFTVAFLFSTTVAKAQDANQLLQNVNTALSASDCDRAQRAYDAWKGITGRADANIEARIKACRDGAARVPLERAMQQGDVTVLLNSNLLVDLRHPVSSKISHTEAINLCKNSSLAGMNNWRLPTRNELERIYAGGISLRYFEDEYWSSEWHSEVYCWVYNAKEKRSYWGRSRDGGFQIHPTQHAYVRCVSEINSNFTSLFNNSFAQQRANLQRVEEVRQQEERQKQEDKRRGYTRLSTGLRVQLNPSQDVNWRAAQRYCENLKTDGMSWRVPTISEVRQIQAEGDKFEFIAQRRFISTWTSADGTKRGTKLTWQFWNQQEKDTPTANNYSLPVVCVCR